MYGNYCGPYWSDGKFQTSVVGTVSPIDEFDETCMEHDKVYALGGDLKRADAEFYRKNVGKGVIRTAAALAVGAQGQLRRGKYRTPIIDLLPLDQLTMPNLRGVPKRQSNNNVAINSVNTTKSMLGGVQVDAPSAISGVFTAKQTKTKSIADGVSVSGQEFIAPVECQGVSTFGLGKSALIAPAYFYGGVLGQLSRAYQNYRWRKLIVHYIPKVSTGLSGQIIICSSENVSEPDLQPESASFLARAMVSGNGVMAPLWTPVKMKIPTDNVWRHIDPTVNADINDNILAELQVYTQAATAQQVGYLWLEYEVELCKPMLAPHATSLPLASGPGTRVTFQDQSATNATGAPVILVDTGASGFTGMPGGSIFRFVLDLQACSIGTGATFSNAWVTTTLNLSAASGITKGTGAFAIVGGLTVYYVNTQGQQYGCLYTSLESAIAGLASGQVIQNTATTSKSTLVGDMALVRLGVSTLAYAQ